MSAAPVAKLSVEEYLALDRAAEVPSEYHDGELFPLDAVSLQHGLISNHVGRRVGERLEGGRCQIAAQIRVRVSPTKFVFPDQVVYCGKAALTDEAADTITNPKVIIEILSPSTADYDYGTKFGLYRRLPSFEEYVLIAQDEPKVEVFRKTPDGRWILSTYDGLDSTAKVESLEITLPLAELYAGVELTTP